MGKGIVSRSVTQGPRAVIPQSGSLISDFENDGDVVMTVDDSGDRNRRHEQYVVHGHANEDANSLRVSGNTSSKVHFLSVDPGFQGCRKP